jgi:hypothetical protein
MKTNFRWISIVKPASRNTSFLKISSAMFEFVLIRAIRVSILLYRLPRAICRSGRKADSGISL